MPVVDEIKRKVDIVEFIGSFIPLKKAGRNFKAVCPFHQEKTPSFVISPDRQIWHCFGACQEGGDVIKFLMKWDNLTFGESVKELAQKAGIKLAISSIEDEKWRQKERLYQVNNLAAQYFRYVLTDTTVGKKARDYLKERSIRTEIAKKFQIGYAPQSWDSLIKFLLKKKFTTKEIDDTGLTVSGQGGRGYDRFRGRITFPIKDARSNVIGFSGRSLDEKEKSAKYINTPETLIYHKRESLYGIDLAKEAIKKEECAILVEGEFDVISPHQQGIENIVALKGSAITREQLMLLKRYANRIIFALDADSTGEDAVKRGTDEAERLDFEIEVMVLDFAKDPDEAVRKDLAKFKKALKNKVPVYDFILTSLQKKYSIKDPFGKKNIADEMLGYLEKIQNPIVQSHYIKKTTQLLDVSEASLERAIRVRRQKQSQQKYFIPKPKEKEASSRYVVIQKYTLSLLFQSKPDDGRFEIVRQLEASDFSIPSYGTLFEQYVLFRTEHPAKNIAEFVKLIKKELIPVFDELYLFATYEEGFAHSNIMRLIFEIKKNALKKHMEELMADKKDFSADDKKSLRSLSLKLQEVEKKLVSL